MQCMGSPLHTVHLESDLVSGPVVVGVRPCFPIEGVSFLLGNDLAGGKVLVKPELAVPMVTECNDKLAQKYPGVFSACAVTRAMSKRQALDDDVDLTRSFLDSTATPSSGKLSAGEVGEVSFADVFAGRGPLVSEQGADPDMSLLFESAVSAQEIVSVSCGFFLRNGVLMRKRTLSVCAGG